MSGLVSIFGQNGLQVLKCGGRAVSAVVETGAGISRCMIETAERASNEI
jgi:hypothetical protein